MLPDLDVVIAVSLAGLALSLTPGPSMLYVLSRSVSQSRSAGLASAVGLGLGGMLLAVGTAFGLYATRADARSDLFAYIEGFYNSRRLHSGIGYRSPADMERMAA